MLFFERGSYNEHNTPTELHQYQVPPPPSAKSRWRGVSHYDLATAIIDNFDKHFDVVPIKQTYAVSPNGMTMLGTMELGRRIRHGVEPLQIPGIPHETNQSIGFIHSNDRRKSLNVCYGGSVMVCTNGMVVGSETWKRKHTTGLFIKDWIADCLTSMWENMQTTSKKIQHLTNHEVSKKEHDDNLLYMGRQGILPWKWVGEIDREWDTASTSETHPFNSGTAWDWYNCTTEIIKKIPTALQFTALERCYNVARVGVIDSTAA